MKEKDLSKKLDTTRLPVHIAIIMDGNGRWAKQRSKERIEGHKAGAESVRAVVRACRKLGIKVLTLYAFSSENWRRPKKEVQALMRLLVQYLRSEYKELKEKGIKLRVIGRITDLPKYVQKSLDMAIKSTENNSDMILNIALSYGGRDEIVRAARKLMQQAAEGKVTPQQLTEENFPDFLDSHGLPDPDLLIRTGGENRISNFLLWQMAYTEFYFTETLWPDFREDQLIEAIKEYQRRERRFGMISEQIYSSKISAQSEAETGTSE